MEKGCFAFLFAVPYLKFSLWRFVDHLRAVPKDVAVKNPKVLNVVSDDIGHLGFVLSNHHPKITFKDKNNIESHKTGLYKEMPMSVISVNFICVYAAKSIQLKVYR